MGSHIFGFFWVRQFFIFTVNKRTRMFVQQMKSKVFFIQSWDRENCIVAHRIDFKIFDGVSTEETKAII